MPWAVFSLSSGYKQTIGAGQHSGSAAGSGKFLTETVYDAEFGY